VISKNQVISEQLSVISKNTKQVNGAQYPTVNSAQQKTLKAAKGREKQVSSERTVISDQLSVISKNIKKAKASYQ